MAGTSPTRTCATRRTSCAARDLLIDHDTRQGYLQLKDELRIALYREWLDGTPVRTLREALHTGEPYDAKPSYGRRPLWDAAAAVALLRLNSCRQPAGQAGRDAVVGVALARLGRRAL
ncbi:MAG: hypothetical protein IPO58_11485 [Betaproteobacteria bacterium]|nr:hypothetical protein [Betaproteobacteria bacterium]